MASEYVQVGIDFGVGSHGNLRFHLRSYVHKSRKFAWGLAHCKLGWHDLLGSGLGRGIDRPWVGKSHALLVGHLDVRWSIRSQFGYDSVMD